MDNRKAHQLYLGSVSHHPRNPLTSGEEFVAILEPGVCVAIVPADVAPSFPIEISLPELGSVPTDVADLPIAELLDTTDSPHP